MELEMFELDNLEFLNINVKLRNGKIKTFDVKEELKIDEENLSKHFIEQPGKYAWWAVLAEIAKSYEERLEAELERIEAEADKRVRKQLELDGIKITENLVKQNIKLDKEYREALEKYQRVKKNANILGKISKAFEHRKEMLINLGAHVREKINNENDIRSLKKKVNDIIKG